MRPCPRDRITTSAPRERRFSRSTGRDRSESTTWIPRTVRGKKRRRPASERIGERTHDGTVIASLRSMLKTGSLNDSLVFGMAGAVALTAIHQAAKAVTADAPRMDVVGMRALVRGADRA